MALSGKFPLLKSCVDTGIDLTCSAFHSTVTGGFCDWGQGSTWSVIACCLYVVASCIMCCTPRAKPLLCKHREHSKEKKEAEKMAKEDEAKDKVAQDAEAGHSGSHHEAAGAGGDEAAAHASAY